MKNPLDIAKRVAERVEQSGQVESLYAFDLALEAMLELDRVIGAPIFSEQVFQTLEKRMWTPETVIPFEKQPFCHLNWKLIEATGDPAWAGVFVAESDRYRREVTRSPEGAVAHYADKPGRNLLIDQLQDFCARMAHAGQLTGDTSYYTECADQFEIYRSLVRNPETGLWCQGRGWLDDPMEYSPGAWSRGQGWVLRGLVESLCALPRESDEFARVHRIFLELTETLLAVQGPDGMWHQLLHLPPEQSGADSTGTGLIVYNFLRALKEGFTDNEQVRASAEKAWDALTECVTPEGIVLKACPGPGPLWEMESYLGTEGRAEDGEGHGPFSVLFACAGRLL
jgi:rhamnogalacturonyl hydrolase YesR